MFGSLEVAGDAFMQSRSVNSVRIAAVLCTGHLQVETVLDGKFLNV